MAIIYYKAIHRGVRELEDVPAYWYDDVKKMIEEDDS